MHPGQAIYFPTGWHHGVLNLDETVFVSAFHSTSKSAPTIAPPYGSLLHRKNVA